jgi:tetratricopeptide (TPR) repeat protein
MRTIKVFLASSEELKEDREQLEILINRKNKEWINKDLFLELNIWEDTIDSVSKTRLQDEYNQKITESDIFIMLFFTKVGKYTEEEFSVAFETFKKINKPVIFTFEKDALVKMSEIKKEDFETLCRFRKYLLDIGHFLSTYKNIDDLKNQISDRLSKLYPDISEKESDEVFSGQKKYPRELTIVPKIDPTDIIGRDNYLRKLHDYLFCHKKVVLINGLAGIGKTMVAQAYVSENYENYRHFVWVSQTGDHAARAFLENKDLLDNLEIDLSSINENDRLRTVLNKQRSILSKPNLLIIDNADRTICEFYQILPGFPNWHVIITSQEKLEQFENINLDKLSRENALMLFKLHCTRFTNDHQIIEVLKTIDYHTLTIEILAKTAQLQRTPLDKLLHALKDDMKANISIHGGQLKVDKIKSFLKSIFNFSSLSENQKWLMKQFCLLPSDFHNFDMLIDLLEVNSIAWADDFSETLETLCKKGWILKNEETDSFKMHLIIIEVASDKLELKFSEVSQLVKKVGDLLFFEEDTDDYFPRSKWIGFGNSILDYFSNALTTLNKNPEIFNLQKNLGWLYRELDDYKKAAKLLEEALNSGKEFYGLKHTFVTDCQSKLGVVYDGLGLYNQAFELLDQAVKTDFEILDKTNPLIALHQSNLAIVYGSFGEWEKSNELETLALEADIRTFGSRHPRVAVRKFNHSITRRKLGDYDSGLKLIQEAVSDGIETYGEKHPIVASRLNSLGRTYMDIKDYQKAIDHIEKSYNIFTELFGTQCPQSFMKKGNLGEAYCRAGRFEEAKRLLVEAVELSFEVYGKNNYNTAINQNKLATVYFETGFIDKAQELWQIAHETFKTKLGENNPRTLEVQRSLEKCNTV